MKTNQIILAACIAAGLFSASSLRAGVNRYWDGGGADNNWLTVANWDGDTLPTTGLGTVGDVLYLNDTSANYPIFSAANGSLTYQTIRIGYGSAPVGPSADGRLDITGGTLSADGTGQIRIGRGAGRTGTLNQSGGIFNAGGIVQLGVDAGSTGIVNLSNGTFNANRNATEDTVAGVSLSLAGAGGATGHGTFNLTGGTLATRTGVLVGNNAGAIGLFYVNGGVGTATIGSVNAADSGFWVQRASGTLRATVDSTGFTLGTISLFDGTADNPYLTFAAGSTLDLGFSGAAPTSTMSWSLITFADGSPITDSGLTLGAGEAAAGWSFAFVDAGGAAGVDTLRITYTVPEPTVGALAGLGLLIAAFRARHRA
jgi:hypothetical protein